VHLSADLPKIVIEKAVYGVPGDAKRTRDVRAKLQHLVDTGEFTFEVARMVQGDDPAFLIVKTLDVECTIDAVRKTFKGVDPDTITLALPPTPSQQAAEIRCGARGQPLIEAWQAGQYDLKTASGKVHRVDVSGVPQSVEVGGPWEVYFEPNWGAPEHVTFDKLISWSAHSDPGVKHFSGAATYTNTVNVPGEMLGEKHRLYLDLGKVQVMAQVKLNGKDLGILWKPPYRLDITETARPGKNEIEVRVANLWVNRLIGDEQLPEDSARNKDGTLKEWPQWLKEGKPSPTGRYTFTTWRLWSKDAPLQDSGLLGPVMLQSSQVMRIEQ
jgi:hypothetical protein